MSSIYGPKSKIHARLQQRPEDRVPKELFYSSNRIWDEINDLQNLQRECMSTVAGSIATACDFLKDPRFARFITEPLKLAELVKGIDVQFGVYQKRFNDICKKHLGKAGAATSADENMAAIGIGNEYADLQSFYNTVVHALTADLTSEIMKIERAAGMPMVH